MKNPMHEILTLSWLIERQRNSKQNVSQVAYKLIQMSQTCNAQKNAKYAKKNFTVNISFYNKVNQNVVITTSGAGCLKLTQCFSLRISAH